MTATGIPRAPKHLKASGRALWSAVVNRYDLEAHALHILAAACEAQDRMTEAREAIDADGLTVSARYGTKAHPAIAVERDCRNALLRSLRELGLDVDTNPSHRGAPPPPSRWR